MMVIDHLGYRLLAMTLLPIDHDTLVYGSPDGGKTVTCSDRELPGVVDEVAQQLHLKEHVVGPRGNQLRTPLPCDVEIHRGTDGRRYCVDVARLFPPEPPKYAGLLLRRCGGCTMLTRATAVGPARKATKFNKCPHLCHLLRPELVRAHTVRGMRVQLHCSAVAISSLLVLPALVSRAGAAITGRVHQVRPSQPPRAQRGGAECIPPAAAHAHPGVCSGVRGVVCGRVRCWSRRG